MSEIKLRQTQSEVERRIGRQSKGERHGMFDRRY